jgi:hypothetical protein
MIYIVIFLWIIQLVAAADDAVLPGIENIKDLQLRSYEDWRNHLVEKDFLATPEHEENYNKIQALRASWFNHTHFKTFTYTSSGLTVGGTLVYTKDLSLHTSSTKHPLYVIVRDGKGTHNEINPLHITTMWNMAQKGFVAVGSHYRGGEFSEGTIDYHTQDASKDIVRLINIALSWPAIDAANIVLEGHMYGATVALQAEQRLLKQPSFSSKLIMLLTSPIFDLHKKMTLLKNEPEATRIWRDFFELDTPQIIAHEKAYKLCSPITWPDKIKAALLIINGGKNMLCITTEQIMPFIDAVKKHGSAVVEFHEYPDAGYTGLNPGCTSENPTGGETTQRILDFFLTYKK